MVDWVALAWLAASGAGALVSGIGVLEGWRDIQAMRDERNGRLIIAKDYFRTQAGRLVIALLWFIAGIPLLFDDFVVPATPILLLLVGTNAGLGIFSYLSLRDRRRLASAARH